MSYLVARLMMENSIMTEKIARRGLPLSVDYSADLLATIHVRDAASPDVVCLRTEQSAEEVRTWLGSREPGSLHTGFPVLNRQQNIVGVVTRKDLAKDHFDASTLLADVMNRPAVAIRETATVREAIDLMVAKGIGRLPLVTAEQPSRVAGIVTRSDLLRIYGERLRASRRLKRTISLGSFKPGQDGQASD